MVARRQERERNEGEKTSHMRKKAKISLAKFSFDLKKNGKYTNSKCLPSRTFFKILLGYSCVISHLIFIRTI
jgi:hypothetical protein